MPRIVAGHLGGRTIPGPPGKGTRPTSDKVREALFNRLEGWDALVDARVLDLYAGTGALAFEALSRGAEHALLAELHGPTAAQLRRTASELGLEDRVEIRKGKAESIAGQLAAPAERLPAGPSTVRPAEGTAAHSAEGAAGRTAEGAAASLATLVFLDPPYDVPTEALEQLLHTLRPALADDALVVVERSSRTRPLVWPEGWGDDGTKSYGETVLQFGGPA